MPDDKMRDLEAAVIEDHTLDSPNLMTVTNDFRSNIDLNHHFSFYWLLATGYWLLASGDKWRAAAVTIFASTVAHQSYLLRGPAAGLLLRGLEACRGRSSSSSSLSIDRTKALRTGAGMTAFAPLTDFQMISLNSTSGRISSFRKSN